MQTHITASSAPLATEIRQHPHQKMYKPLKHSRSTPFCRPFNKHHCSSSHVQTTKLFSSQKESQSFSQLEIEVPTDQRPVNELAELKSSVLYSWATLEISEYAQRLFILWAGIFAFLGGPIAAQTFDPLRYPLEFFLSASSGSLLIVAIASLRIYLGWKYVGDRLMTATLEYEETGWYDGQIFVKPPEILTRDRLLGTYEARPVLARLRTTLQGTGLALLVTAVALFGIVEKNEAEEQLVVPDGVVMYSTPRMESLDDSMTDDEAAEAQALALAGVHGWDVRDLNHDDDS